MFFLMFFFFLSRRVSHHLSKQKPIKQKARFVESLFCSPWFFFFFFYAYDFMVLIIDLF